MTTFGRLVFGILIVIILIAFWLAIQAAGGIFGAPAEWTVR